VGKGFKTNLTRKCRIKIACNVTHTSNNNKNPPSPSRTAPGSAAVLLIEINAALPRNAEGKDDIRRKWCVLIKPDSSRMDSNKGKQGC
jgi:hypothetical protein